MLPTLTGYAPPHNLLTQRPSVPVNAGSGLLSPMVGMAQQKPSAVAGAAPGATSGNPFGNPVMPTGPTMPSGIAPIQPTGGMAPPPSLPAGHQMAISRLRGSGAPGRY